MGEVVIILEYHLSRDAEQGFKGDVFGATRALVVVSR